jgi:hypothetical protein
MRLDGGLWRKWSARASIIPPASDQKEPNTVVGTTIRVVKFEMGQRFPIREQRGGGRQRCLF